MEVKCFSCTTKITGLSDLL